MSIFFNESLIVKNLRDTLDSLNEITDNENVDISKLQEAWNDALKFKEDALAAFRLGFIDLTTRATAEQLTWACAKRITTIMPNDQLIPEELKELHGVLAATYYSNISIFRSAPDTWAIEQLFPIMPILWPR